MKFGYTKKTKETKEKLLELMPYELEYTKIFLNIGNAKSKGKRGYVILNEPKAVKNSVDKKRMFRLFKENKIKSLRFIDLDNFLGKIKAIGYLTIGKDLVLRDIGLNILGISQLINFLKSKEYATLKEKKILEFRVLVFKDKILRTTIKLPKEKDFVLKQENCKFVEVKPNFSDEDKKNIINSVKCLGLDLGGVDVLINDKNEMKIIEVNSGMSLCSKSVRLVFKEITKWWKKDLKKATR